jgi:hypothetical protein
MLQRIRGMLQFINDIIFYLKLWELHATVIFVPSKMINITFEEDNCDEHLRKTGPTYEPD